MKKTLLLFVIIFTSFEVFCQFQIPNNYVSLANNSAFIFKGKILLKNTSTLNMKNVDSVCVVRVDEIIESKKHYINQKGKLITIKSKNIKDLSVGDERVFFTNGLIWGESLCVLELGSYIIRATYDQTSLKKQIIDIQENEEQKLIKERYAKAEIALVGKVQKIEAINVNENIISEHHPYWNKAEVQVIETLKGNNNSIVYFYYPSSNDRMWANSPKFKVGDSGIWFLNNSDLMETDISGFAIISKKFFFSQELVNKIKNIVK